jgi:hypothetical protein
MRGTLPDQVLDRPGKAEFSQALTRHLDALRTLLVETLPRRSANLDAEGMARLYDCYASKSEDIRGTWELWGALGCENALLSRHRPDLRKEWLS